MSANTTMSAPLKRATSSSCDAFVRSGCTSTSAPRSWKSTTTGLLAERTTTATRYENQLCKLRQARTKLPERSRPLTMLVPVLPVAPMTTTRDLLSLESDMLSKV